MDWRDQGVVSGLCTNRETVARMAGAESDSGIIGRGVEQGCLVSPLLFSIYAEMVIREALESVEEGVGVKGVGVDGVGGVPIGDVKYADDQGMVANREAGLQSLMDSLNTTAKHYDIKLILKRQRLW